LIVIDIYEMEVFLQCINVMNKLVHCELPSTFVPSYIFYFTVVVWISDSSNSSCDVSNFTL